MRLPCISMRGPRVRTSSLTATNSPDGQRENSIPGSFGGMRIRLAAVRSRGEVPVTKPAVCAGKGDSAPPGFQTIQLQLLLKQLNPAPSLDKGWAINSDCSFFMPSLGILGCKYTCGRVHSSSKA